MVQLQEPTFLTGQFQARTLRHGMIRLKIGWVLPALTVFQVCQETTTLRYLKQAPKSLDISNVIQEIWQLTVNHAMVVALVSKLVSVFKAVSLEQNGQRSIQKFQKAKPLESLKFGLTVKSFALSMISLVRLQVSSTLIKMVISICRKHELSVLLVTRLRARACC